MGMTYKQEVKDKSRREIWSHAVSSLTSKRNESRILNRAYLTKLEGFVEHTLGRELDKEKTSAFYDYVDRTYGSKSPDDLKVAFFCGPEPENDVEVLLSLGVKSENMHAFECANVDFKQAVHALHGKYPQVKIYNGTIESYSRLHATTFDIVYLDFTKSMLSVIKTICTIIDNNMLNPLSVLAVNTTFPDRIEHEKNAETLDQIKTDKEICDEKITEIIRQIEEDSSSLDVSQLYDTEEVELSMVEDPNLAFLCEYFFYDTMFEWGVIKGDDDYDERTPGFGRVESPGAYGYNKPIDMLPSIDEHFEEAYSAFQSDFINCYANITKPIYAIMSQQILYSRLFKKSRINDLLANQKAIDQLDFDSFCDGMTDFSMKYRMSSNTKFFSFFNTKEDGRLYSRNESLLLWDLLVNSRYLHQYDLSEDGFGTDEDGGIKCETINIADYLAEPLENSLSDVEDEIKPHNVQGRFCDVPMIHLWYEMIVNTLGYPYHVNIKNHIRHSYTAKTRKMCVDVFTFDQCRGFYDWLPMIEYQADYVKDKDYQMIIRMCIDAIAKNSLGVINQQYYGSALIGEGTEPWAHFGDFPKRNTLNSE